MGQNILCHIMPYYAYYFQSSYSFKTDRALNKGDDMVACFPWAKIEAIPEVVEKIMGPGKEGSILVH